MYVPFDELPDQSRIWIYQSDRKLTVIEKELAAAILQDFCENWAAHNVDLKASFALLHDQFIVLATDEDFHQPSGCSIDTSVRTLKSLEQRFGFSLFDRTKVAFFIDQAVVTYPLSHLKSLFDSGELSKESITFNNLVPSRGDLAREWKTPVEKTWLTKYLPNSALAS